MPEPNSMMLLGSGVVPPGPVSVKASEGIEAHGVLKGFRHVESGPLVRSSYPADEQADEGMRIG
jgi:hypothetical protein